jgi:hypothetical protein|tara:strand:+ start:336 stop:551 length:216 start_codon:yes stop_codon:yes gene_type:complete
MTSSWKADWGNDSMKLRQETLKILMKKFPKYNKKVYECADEWCKKQVTTNGLVGYFEAYYLPKITDAPCDI